MKTYLKDLTPEEIIKRLKNGEIIKFAQQVLKQIEDVE